MIQIKNLNKIYINNKQRALALQDINLKVNHSEIFGVIGKSGAGKSTLVRCVNLLEKPTSGQIFIDDIDITTFSERKLRQQRRQIGMIFQQFNLLESRTVYKNIAFPMELIGYKKKDIKNKILPLLELVNLQDRQDYYPKQLSGGQKQRVAIARALVTDPKLLLCDEATSALDPESTHAILQLLKKINQRLNLTILLITHEMNVIKNICDRVAILDNGLLVEQGNVIDIFTQPKSEITKRLTQNVLHFVLQKRPKTNLYPVIRLTFIGSSTKEPIVIKLLQRFNVTANILQADLESIHDATIGFMVCELIGDQKAISKALQYLANLKIKTEVIGYA